MFGQSRWIKLADVDDDDFLKTGWDDLNGEHVQSYVENHDNGWTANQVCPLFLRGRGRGGVMADHAVDLGL